MVGTLVPIDENIGSGKSYPGERIPNWTLFTRRWVTLDSVWPSTIFEKFEIDFLTVSQIRFSFLKKKTLGAWFLYRVSVGVSKIHSNSNKFTRKKNQ